MAKSYLMNLVSAVTDRLNNTSFSVSFTADKRHVPLFELEDMDVLHVSVVPHSQEWTKLTRVLESGLYRVDVVVQQRPTSLTDDAINDILALVEDIVLLFYAERLTDTGAGVDAICTGVMNDPVYDPEHLQNFRQITSVVTLAFRVL